MTRNKEPGKGKFHGQDLSYFIFGNKGWGGGGGGGIERINGYGHPPPPPWKDLTPMSGSILITLQNLA